MRVQTTVINGVVPTLCRQCDSRCGVKVCLEQGRIIDIEPLAAHPVNRGHICPRGRAAVDVFYHPRRLLRPLKRTPGGSMVEISREQALDEIGARLAEIRRREGARAVAVWKGEAVGFGQQEEYARRFIHAFGSPNYFSNDSACYNGRYLGYRLVHGYWNGFPDFEHADLIVLVGTNPPACHPPFSAEIASALERGARLVVIDPRRNPIAARAHLHLRPHPGTDGALAWGVCRLLIESGSYDRDLVERFSVGFDEFRDYSRRFSLEVVEAETGVARDAVCGLADLLAANRPRVLIYVGAGLEHHQNGVNNIRVFAALGVLCGSLDIEGGQGWPEPFPGRSLTLYDQIPLEQEGPIGADRFPVLYELRRECHTMTGIDYILGKGSYPLRGLIVTGANPAVTNPNSKKVEAALRSLELLVVNDLFLTQTAKWAHYVLPAASFLERSELHVHSRYQLVNLTRRVATVAGVEDEYSLWRQLALRLGFAADYFPWSNEDEVNRWILEPTGITVEDLWRHPEGIQYKPIRYRKYEDTGLPTFSGKVEFTSAYLQEKGLDAVPVYRPPAYKCRPDPDYPLVLTTGARKPLLYHSRHQNIARFRTVFPHPEVEMHPEDARRLGLEDGTQVRVVSRVGEVTVHLRVAAPAEMLPGFVELYHGWEEARANLVTPDDVNDPISGFPTLKAVPVRLEPAG